MRNADQKRKIGRFYGVGIGPGGPGLVTLRAKEILDAVDVIFAPKANEGSGSIASSIISAITSSPKRIRTLIFPMTKDKKILKTYWMRAARDITACLKAKKDVAFLTLGDPLIYSTYIYLLKTLRRHFPEIVSETVCGISSFQAAASKLGLALVEGTQTLALLPVTGNFRAMRDALRKFDTVVFMKIGTKLAQLVRLLNETKLVKKAVLVSRLGQPGEQIVHDLNGLEDKRLGYLSVVIVKRKKEC